MMITKYLLLLAKTKKPPSGFTILESLVAIIVVALLMTMMAPVLVFSVGTRVQAKRVEIATQAANNYISGLKTGAIPTPNYIVKVNNYTSAYSPTDANKSLISANIAPPSNTLPTCNAITVTTNSGYCQNAASTDPIQTKQTTVSLYCIPLDDVDVDTVTTNDTGCTNTSNKDLVIQVVRSVYETTPDTNTTLVTDPSKGYIVGVRVYRADAFTTGSTLLASCRISGNAGCPKDAQGNFISATQSTRTAGLGSRVAPLVEVTAEIPPTGTVNYTDLKNRLCVRQDYPTSSSSSSSVSD
ncbi:MAG TPA: hormogonium polysaccharide secretion pseudopilin HpsB, partial [Allocoleopsis sp.]